MKRVDYWMTPLYEVLPSGLFPRRQRKIHAYCVGMPRSGTVSIYEMFRDAFRSAHEPESRFLTNRIMAFYEQRLAREKLSAYVRHRDRRMQLEMDSSYLNAEIVDILVDSFPDSKFILTIRDCVSWLDSFTSFQLNRPEFRSMRKAGVRKHMDFYLGAGRHAFAKGDHVLEEIGLYPLDSYLAHWTFHNRRVLGAVPAERLLVIRTNEIGSAAGAMESFLGLEPNLLPRDLHANPATRRHSVVENIDKSFLAERVRLHCSELMNRFFPGYL